MPNGSVLRLDRRVRRVRGPDGGSALVGGSPGRLARLQPGAAALLVTGTLTVTDRTSARLARYLLDAGLAHPVGAPPSAAPSADQVTVVIPVRDRPEQLDRLLAALSTDLAAGLGVDRAAGPAVIVVDDGSTDAEATRGVAVRHRAALLRHPWPLGPAAARNTGLAAVGTPLVAFLDSDVRPEQDWLGRLLAELADPAVGLVAPRIVPLAARAPGRPDRPGWIGRYEAVASSLDLGPDPARVRPGGRVAYLPSAAMLARVSALRGLAGPGFDPDLPIGEDVDLVWRLHDAGWRVRYQPAARVGHDHRTQPWAWLARKARYGTSAAPLAARHPGRVPPLVASDWTAAVWALLLLQRRWAVAAAGAVAVAGTARLARRLHPAGPMGASPASAQGRWGLGAQGGWGLRLAAGTLAPTALASTGLQLCAALLRHWWPVALLAATRSRRARRALLAALAVQAVADRSWLGSGLDPVRFQAARRLDDLAYGAGVWWGACRSGRLDPLLPRLDPGRPR